MALDARRQAQASDLQIPEAELAWLNIYRASELHGGLVLGQLALRVRDPRLMLNLMRHAAEEIEHARRWTETILAVGGKPRPVRRTYQSLYAREVGPLSSLLQVLALTQVFERRVCWHFTAHAGLPGTHPEVKKTLEWMVAEEDSHLSWVKIWLDERATEGKDVAALMARFLEVDQRVYEELRAQSGFPIVSDQPFPA